MSQDSDDGGVAAVEEGVRNPPEVELVHQEYEQVCNRSRETYCGQYDPYSEQFAQRVAHASLGMLITRITSLLNCFCSAIAT